LPSSLLILFIFEGQDASHVHFVASVPFLLIRCMAVAEENKTCILPIYSVLREI